MLIQSYKPLPISSNSLCNIVDSALKTRIEWKQNVLENVYKDKRTLLNSNLMIGYIAFKIYKNIVIFRIENKPETSNDQIFMSYLIIKKAVF